MFIHKTKSISGFTFRQPYPPSFGVLAGSPHLGVDWASNYEPIYAPCDGKIIQIVYGAQGGWWVYFEESTNNGKLIHRFGHCSPETQQIDLGWCKEGDIIGYSGNTGLVSTSPHTHHDISKNSVNIQDIGNFIDPEIYFNNKTMELPKWFKDNRTQEWSETTQIVTDWADPFRLVPQYVMAEYLRKAVQKPTVNVNVFINQFTFSDKEMKAYRLAVQECVKMYAPFCNLVFNKVEKKNLGVLEFLSAGPAVRLKNWTPFKGLNVIITDDKDLASLSTKVQGGNLIGYMIGAQNTCLIRRSSLSESDPWDRTTLSLFAGTLPHELSHWFADHLTTEDWTHKWDYEYSLTNYLSQIPFTQLNISANRIKFNLE